MSSGRGDENLSQMLCIFRSNLYLPLRLKADQMDTLAISQRQARSWMASHNP